MSHVLFEQFFLQQIIEMTLKVPDLAVTLLKAWERLGRSLENLVSLHGLQQEEVTLNVIFISNSLLLLPLS